MPILAEQRLIRPLRQKFRQQSRELGAYSAAKRVEGRNADGTINLRPLGGECVERSNICSAYSGQLIQVPCGNGLGRLGASGVAMARFSRVSGNMWVESISPSSFARGGTYTVTVTGGGFTTGSVFEFLLPGTEDVNPGVTITASEYVSFTEFTLEIEIAVDCELIPDGGAGLSFDNPGSAM